MHQPPQPHSFSCIKLTPRAVQRLASNNFLTSPLHHLSKHLSNHPSPTPTVFTIPPTIPPPHRLTHAMPNHSKPTTYDVSGYITLTPLTEEGLANEMAALYIAGKRPIFLDMPEPRSCVSSHASSSYGSTARERSSSGRSHASTSRSGTVRGTYSEAESYAASERSASRGPRMIEAPPASSGRGYAGSDAGPSASTVRPAASHASSSHGSNATERSTSGRSYAPGSGSQRSSTAYERYSEAGSDAGSSVSTVRPAWGAPTYAPSNAYAPSRTPSHSSRTPSRAPSIAPTDSFSVRGSKSSRAPSHASLRAPSYASSRGSGYGGGNGSSRSYRDDDEHGSYEGLSEIW